MVGSWATKSLTWLTNVGTTKASSRAATAAPASRDRTAPIGTRDVETPQPRRGRRQGNGEDERDRDEHDDLDQLLEEQAGGEQAKREHDGPIRDPWVEFGAERRRPAGARAPPPLRR